MNKIVLLSTALAFFLPSASASYGMDPEELGMEVESCINQPTYHQQYSAEFPSEILHSLTNAKRLSTPQSHRDYLRDAILSANKQILITSHGVDRKAFEDGGLYDLLAGASNRGVKIYIYNIDSKDTDNKTFFQDYGISYAEAYTHGKLLAIDDKKVAIGSYNWLSSANSWENATFCLSGEKCKDIVPLLWRDLKYYRNRQFNNLKQIKEYENNCQNQAVDICDLDQSTKLFYLHTLKQHRDFIAYTFQYAQSSLVFCAPFIQEKSGYQEDFNWNLLSNTMNRGVHIYFACRAEDPKLPSFRGYLGTLLQSPLMHLIPLSNIHQKTIIIDDNTILEGSFNCLSAARDEKSEYHNHEVSLMLHGSQAKGFIQDFWNSSIGQAITNATSTQNPQPNKSNELITVVELAFSSWQNNFKSSSKPTNFEIFSGRNYDKDGFCVRFNKKDYLVDDHGKINYFSTKAKAQEAAYQYQ